LSVSLNNDISVDSVTINNSGAVAAGDTKAVTGGVVYQAFKDLEDSLNIQGDGIKYFHVTSQKNDSEAAGSDSIAIGPAAVAEGSSSIAIGTSAGTNLNGQHNVSIGYEANKDLGQHHQVTAVGGKTRAEENAVALGYKAIATQDGVALGSDASAANQAIASGKGALAQGKGAQASD